MVSSIYVFQIAGKLNYLVADTHFLGNLRKRVLLLSLSDCNLQTDDL